MEVADLQARHKIILLLSIERNQVKCQMLNFHSEVHCMDILKWIKKHVFNIFTECLKDGGSTKSVISLAANNMARGSIFFLCSSSLNTSRTTATKSEINDVNFQVHKDTCQQYSASTNSCSLKY